ncbi:MAG: formate dehydrogenase [Bilophila wadsworthia]
MIRRHSATAIFMHWYNAACWLLLLFTGFALLANPLMQPVGDWWSSLWTGAFGALGLLRLHVVVGSVDHPVCRLPARPGAGGGPAVPEITDPHRFDLVVPAEGLWLVLGERLMRRLRLDPELPRKMYNAGRSCMIIAVLCSLGSPDRADPRVRLRQAGTEGLLQICLLAHFCCAGLMAFPARAHLHGGLRTREAPALRSMFWMCR